MNTVQSTLIKMRQSMFELRGSLPPPKQMFLHIVERVLHFLYLLYLLHLWYLQYSLYSLCSLNFIEDLSEKVSVHSEFKKAHKRMQNNLN